MDNNKKETDIKKNQDPDMERVFLSSEVLPSVADSFTADVNTLDEAVKTGDIVLDTNALLIPYGAGANSLTQIIKILNKLKREKRVYLPSQVAREFIKNRPNKISELHQGLSDRISRINAIEQFSYPILAGIKEYDKINELINKTRELKKEITKENAELSSKIYSWEWSDPVNTSYKKVFSSDIIIEPAINKDETLKELLRRQKHSIPPGYKDSGKEDLGIGDFLIWKTILHLGQKNKKDLIFISGDEKADWQHRAGGSGFLPRYELLDEYRRASGGKAFYIIQLSKLLELLSAEASSVVEIKKEEVRIQEANIAIINCPYCETAVTWHLGEFPGSSAKPYCAKCEGYFHLHRTHEGVTIHKPNEKASRKVELQSETITCPECTYPIKTELGINPNSTTWCDCPKCTILFPIHRMRDGSIKISRRFADPDE